MPITVMVQVGASGAHLFESQKGGVLMKKVVRACTLMHPNAAEHRFFTANQTNP